MNTHKVWIPTKLTLSARPVAEGVETEDVAAWLTQERVDMAGLPF